MFIENDIIKTKDSLEKTIQELSELEEELRLLYKEYPELKREVERKYFLYLKEEYKINNKLTQTKIKDNVKINLIIDPKYQRLIELEAKIELVKKRIKVLNLKLDSLKLKLDFHKLF